MWSPAQDTKSDMFPAVCVFGTPQLLQCFTSGLFTEGRPILEALASISMTSTGTISSILTEVRVGRTQGAALPAQGMYKVRICPMGGWKTITVDSYFPVLSIGKHHFD